MSTGSVTPDREAVISLTVRGDGRRRDVRAIVDTGFTSYLTLPRAGVTALGLPCMGDMEVTLADRSVTRLQGYECKVLWHRT